MDTSTLLFAAGIIGFVAVIVLILSFITARQKRKEAHKQENYFTKAAEAFGLTVNKKAFLQHRMIGLDDQLKRIIYVDYSNELLQPVLIELKDVSGSRLMVNNDSVVEKIRGADKVTDIFISSVKLRFQFRNNHLSPLDISFYKYGVDSFHSIEHLRQVATEWNDLVNSNCS